MARLKEKVALITGAAQGIGKVTAELFIQEGATVILSDVQDAAGRTLAQSLGPKAFYHSLDVSNKQQWETIMGFIRNQCGILDILVNNAGITGVSLGMGPQDPEHASLESWHHVHAINLDGTFLGCQYAIAAMKKKGGAIVNVSSRSGLVGIPNAAAYASSKAAIRNHTKTVALYCAEQGYHIRCNSVHPAAILTPLWDAMLGEKKEEAIAAMSRAIPLGKMGEPLDVAYAIVYLASDEAKYITGAELVLDGGILAGSAAAPKSNH